MSVHDLFAGTTSLKGFPGMLIPDFGFLYDRDVFRGENKTLPGTPGEIASADGLTVDYYDMVIGFHIEGDTDAQLMTRIASLRATLNASNGLYVLTRRLPLATSPFYFEDSCNGQYRGLDWPDTSNALDIEGRIVLRNLDGGWS